MTAPPIQDLKQKLRDGENVYGTCITSSAPRWPGLVAKSKLDFVFIDTEHITLDRAELSHMCRQYRALGISPIVRIPGPDPYRACQVIDDGAIGVVAPYLEEPQQVLELVGATKLRPLKGQILQDTLDGKRQLDGKLKSYLKTYNQENICIANIESMPAVERLDELLGIEGLDAVFIGPHDLSISMGLPERYDHPDYEEIIKTIIKKARKHALGVGIHFSLDPQRQIQWIGEGVNIVIHSSDMALFSQRLQSDMELIKSATGENRRDDTSKNSVTI